MLMEKEMGNDGMSDEENCVSVLFQRWGNVVMTPQTRMGMSRGESN